MTNQNTIEKGFDDGEPESPTIPILKHWLSALDNDLQKGLSRNPEGCPHHIVHLLIEFVKDLASNVENEIDNRQNQIIELEEKIAELERCLTNAPPI
jgi:hypothetical protein